MITHLLSLLHRLCIPRPVCCFLAGFCSVQVIMPLFTTRGYPLWLSVLFGAISIWSIISWVWTTARKGQS